MWNFLGSLASGVMGLFGGSSNRDAQREANQVTAQNNAAQLAFAREQSQIQQAQALRNEQQQREFAQSSLQWKAEDARKAGIHPIYAMGAAGSSFSPVSIAGGSVSLSPPIAETGMGDALQKSGQSFGRAIQAAQPRDAQLEAVAHAQQTLQTQRLGLENELLSAQIAKAKQEILASPAMPSLAARYGIEGQPGTTFADRWPKTTWEEKNERVSRYPGQPHREAFSVADVGHSNTAGGGYSAIPSKDVQERMEDNWLQQIMWLYRNNILPSIGINESPPPVPAPPGTHWRYHPFYQEYRPHKRNRFGMSY